MVHRARLTCKTSAQIHTHVGHRSSAGHMVHRCCATQQAFVPKEKCHMRNTSKKLREIPLRNRSTRFSNLSLTNMHTTLTLSSFCKTSEPCAISRRTISGDLAKKIAVWPCIEKQKSEREKHTLTRRIAEKHIERVRMCWRLRGFSRRTDRQTDNHSLTSYIPRMLVDAFFESKNMTARMWLLRAARCNGVDPYLCLASTGASYLSTSNCMVET